MWSPILRLVAIYAPGRPCMYGFQQIQESSPGTELGSTTQYQSLGLCLRIRRGFKEIVYAYVSRDSRRQLDQIS